MTACSSASDYEIVQAQGAAYGLVSHGFQYPDRKLIDTLADPARWSSWPQVLRRVDVEAARQLGSVRAFLQPEPGAKATGYPRADSSDLQGTFIDLFGHAVRGKAPPYELEYGRSEIAQIAAELADVAGFYSAFGLEITDDTNDRADHIVIQCEFMSVLCVKAAYAIQENNPDHLDICLQAQQDFLKDHLARWLPAFTHRAGRADPLGFYGALAGFAAALVAGQCRRFDITVGPQTLELRPADPVLDASISCGPAESRSSGAGDELIQLSVHPEPRTSVRANSRRLSASGGAARSR